MTSYIVCLGYDLNADGSIHPVLKSRLGDAIRLCLENKNSTLFLMGGRSFRDKHKKLPSQASVMYDYIKNQAPDVLNSAKVEKEEASTSTIEQLCFLRDHLPTRTTTFIVGSKYFIDRVKLYVEYIFGDIQRFEFVGSDIPLDLEGEMKKTEALKIDQTRKWLKGHKRGDFKTILAEQKAFQSQIQQKETDFPRT